MFRIGVVELVLACGMVLLVFVIPMMFTRFYARLDQRLKKIEKKIDQNRHDGH